MSGRRSVEMLASVGVVAVVVILLVVSALRPSATPGAPPPAQTPTAVAAILGATPSARPVASPIAVTNPDGAAVDPHDDAGFIESARQLSMFAGIWVDRNQRDFHIALTGDVDAAIALVQPLIPSGTTVFLHVVEHTYAELEALVDRVFAERNELLALGIAVNSGGVSERENVVKLGIDPLAPETIALMTERYGDAIAFEYSPSAPPPHEGPWPTVPEVLHAVYKQIGAEELLTCGEVKFPASALEAPGGAEEKVGAVYDGLRETLRVLGSEFGGTDQLTWRLVYQDETEAHFMARQGDLWIDAQTELEDGSWYAGGMGQCRPIVAAPEGMGPGEWALDPDYPPPDGTSTEIHALVWERACSGGRPASGRMSRPVVEYNDDTLAITIAVTPLAGMMECPGPPGTPATFVLPEPVGDRVLLDGGKSPPAPPAAP